MFVTTTLNTHKKKTPLRKTIIPRVTRSTYLAHAQRTHKRRNVYSTPDEIKTMCVCVCLL